MVDASQFSSTVPVPSVDATGCHVPAFGDIYDALLNDYRGVYGGDLDTDYSDQDMEWIGIQALAFSNYCSAFLSAYNSFSPATAQGVGLSSVVKVNGIARATATYSTVDLTIVGVVGTIITNGIVSDGVYQWALPSTVTIPNAGQIIATATCTTLGAVSAAAGTVSGLFNPTRGWQSASNATAATPGQPVERDAELRVRQSESVALPSTTVLDGIVGALEALPGVTRVKVYENDTNLTDGNGVPSHALAFVIDGGDAQAIANVIGVKKTLGAGTYGDAVETYTSTGGITRAIRFFRPTEVPINFALTVRVIKGYTALVQADIVAALVAWTNATDIGGVLQQTRAFVPAYSPDPTGRTFEILSLQLARDGGTPAASDVILAFNEAGYSATNLIAVTVST